MKALKIPVLLAIVVCVSLISCQPKSGKKSNSKYFSNWPEGASPEVVGKRLAENFLDRKFRFQEGQFGRLIYPEVCAWYGALKVADLLNAQRKKLWRDLQGKLEREFSTFLTSHNVCSRIILV